MRPAAVEFLIHMSLSASIAAVNNLSDDGFVDNDDLNRAMLGKSGNGTEGRFSRSEGGRSVFAGQRPTVSVTGANLDLRWNQLKNIEYLTDGGNSWIHTAVLNDRPVVIKTLKPECQDLAMAINEIEAELVIHAQLSHRHIVALLGAGTSHHGIRFLVLERLDGGTLSQIIGYDNRIRDRRRRFWKTKKQFSYVELLTSARAIADAMAYCQAHAIPGAMCLHRDLKPDNIGFTLDGTVKIIDFGLATILDNASPYSDDTYNMSGETGSLRYMAPEVAEGLKYNHKADVYSFGIILWEMNAFRKPFEGMNRESFYERVVHGGERLPISKRWPSALSSLMQSCWSETISERPSFEEIVEILDEIIRDETTNQKSDANHKKRPSISKKRPQTQKNLNARHSTWF
mmetsp:Transcript_7385/g.11359  ORF Transcript_7385/g.11359 Transcript_7385/m.11359 type:complete len:401 (+) Transcript_7385:1-1203(+)